MIEIPGRGPKGTQGDPMGPKGGQGDPKEPKGIQGEGSQGGPRGPKGAFGGWAHGAIWGYSEAISNGRLQLIPALNRHFRGLAPDSVLKPHSNFKLIFSRFGSRRLLKPHLRGFDATGRSSFKPTFPMKRKKIRASGRRHSTPRPACSSVRCANRRKGRLKRGESLERSL